MCLDLGNAGYQGTALESIGNTLQIGGGDDGNFQNITFNNTGSIGFGIGTPLAKFHIVDNTTSSGDLLRIDSTSTNTGNLLRITGSGGRNLLRVSQVGTDPLDYERVTIGQ